MQKLSSYLCFALLLGLFTAQAQTKRHVLFLGNSYTGTHNLPQMVKDVALSAGDTLLFDSYTPGGYRLEDHFSDPLSLNRINTGGWDYMVLQGQSREPILGTGKFKQRGRQLKTQLLQQSPCAVTLLYMTWGRENGDATFCPTYPQMCTYRSMDSTLRVKYEELAQEAGAEISPVSAVWRYLRQNHSSIQLYQTDGSHPSVAGTYAAACSFYTAIFKSDPTAITFTSSLNPADAAIIRQAAKAVVYDSLSYWDYKQQPRSTFAYTIGSGTNEVIFSPINFGVSQTYLWDFGDGNTSTATNPVHSYATDGNYTVTLTTSICNLQGVNTSVSDTVISFCSHTPTVFAKNPWLCKYDTLWTQAADAYQWYSGGVAIPETQRFLPNYKQYNNWNYTVSTTVNGCTELSEIYMASAQWSGYYYDAAFGGNPCDGDTTMIVVLSSFGFTGTEIIRWFHDGLPLPASDDEDTLMVYSSGNYEAYVVNPSSNCPLDTTFTGPIRYQCLGTTELRPQGEVKLYPNPASSTVHIELPAGAKAQEIYMYSTTGRLVKTAVISSSGQLDITELPPGIYYLLLESRPASALKLIKR